jgi:hypothetical protein
VSDHSQADRREFGTDLGEVRHEPVAGRAGLRAYVAAVLAAPFVLLAVTVFWMTTDVYRQHSVYRHLAGTAYGVRLRGANCQVVIDGDSSALVAISPAVIEQRTGLKTCNIAEVAGVQVINGMMVPDLYLEHNARPRYMIFLYVPENLTPAGEWHEVSTFEGVFLRMQIHPDAAFWKMMAKDPLEFLKIVEVGLRTGVQGLLSRPPQVRDVLQGQLPEPGPLMTECVQAFAVRAPDATWLAHLRAAYGVGGTRVLIDVMPEPPCDVTRTYYEARLTPGLIDNTLGTLPLAVYANSGRLHVNDAGSQMESERVAEQILAAEKGYVPGR